MPGENLTRIEAQERRAIVETQSYDIALDLTRGPEVFGSRTVVRFGATEGASTFIDLIARDVREITLNGTPVDASAFGDSRIVLEGLRAQNELIVDADCVYTNTGEGLHRFVDPVDGEVYLYSQFETADAKRMFACFDQPDLKATFDVTVTAPAHWQVISNGAGSSAGEGKHTFATTPKMSTSPCEMPYTLTPRTAPKAKMAASPSRKSALANRK